MKRIFRTGLLAVAVFALVWLGVVIWWQETHRVVNARDVVLWMGLLPLAAIGTLLLLRRSSDGRMKRAESAVAVDASQHPLAAERQERAADLSVIASGWCGMAGDDADTALLAIRGGKAEPQLESAVRDDEGLPVWLASHPSLDVTGVTSWLEAQRTQPVDAALRARLLRCLALLERALPPVLDALLPLFPSEFQKVETVPTRTERVLRVAMLRPEHFDQSTIELLLSFVGSCVAASGLRRHSLRSTVLLSDSNLPLLHWLDESTQELHQRGLDDVLLVIATDSALDPHTLQKFVMHRRFYSARNPQGHVPGEAAAVLALAATAGLPAALKAVPRVHRAASSLREKPIDARGRASSAELAALLGAVLSAAGVEASRCLAVVSDAGRSARRVEELALSMSTLLPELDVVVDRVDLSTALGELGSARSLSLLVMATTLVKAERQPVVVMGLADARERFALLVTVEETAPPSA